MNHSSRCSGLMPLRALPIGPRLSFSMLRVVNIVLGLNMQIGLLVKAVLSLSRLNLGLFAYRYELSGRSARVTVGQLSIPGSRPIAR